jgi:hypothetical protein
MSKLAKRSRTVSATVQHRRMSAGGPGSRSKTRHVGRSMSSARESEGWSSSAASWASQISVGRSSQTTKWSRPSFPNSSGAVRTQSGVCEGARFS